MANWKRSVNVIVSQARELTLGRAYKRHYAQVLIDGITYGTAQGYFISAVLKRKKSLLV